MYALQPTWEYTRLEVFCTVMGDDDDEMFQGTKKSQFYLSTDHCCEVTVKNVLKSIFSMF